MHLCTISYRYTFVVENVPLWLKSVMMTVLKSITLIILKGTRLPYLLWQYSNWSLNYDYK